MQHIEPGEGLNLHGQPLVVCAPEAKPAGPAVAPAEGSARAPGNRVASSRRHADGSSAGFCDGNLAGSTAGTLAVVVLADGEHRACLGQQ